MKKTITYFLMAVAALSASVSCSEDELDPVSIISVDQYTKNEFDK